MNERPVHIEIIIEAEGRIVKSFYAYSVPAVGETINWASKYKVEVTSRDWVIDTEGNPSGNLRCALLCKKVIWPKS